jgi:peptidoglycan/xylan/chitin deacetylase (PgdA/CDA1 family)
MFPPVIMLHHVSDDPRLESLKPYCISRKSFLRLLDYRARNNYHTTSFAEIKGGRHGTDPAKRKVVLSFDDCPKHLFDFAIPELQKRGMKAAFYMPTAHMGQFNSWDVAEGRAKLPLMGAEDLLQLDRMGMEIGGHSHHHVKLKDFADSAGEEVAECRKIIEQVTRKPICSFAWPFGSIPGNYKQALTASGFTYGLGIYVPFEDRLALRRFIYHDGDTEKTLKQKLSIFYTWYRRFTDPFK